MGDSDSGWIERVSELPPVQTLHFSLHWLVCWRIDAVDRTVSIAPSHCGIDSSHTGYPAEEGIPLAA